MSETPLDVAEDGADEVESVDDAPRILPNVTHNRSGWRQGCRCGECRTDHRKALREHRKNKREKRKEERAREERRQKTFPYSTMVAAQLDSLDAVASNPGIAAICLRMAAILDDSDAIPQQPAAAARLLDALKELGVRPRSASSKLESVRNMVNKPLHLVKDA